MRTEFDRDEPGLSGAGLNDRRRVHVADEIQPLLVADLGFSVWRWKQGSCAAMLASIAGNQLGHSNTQNDSMKGASSGWGVMNDIFNLMSLTVAR